MTDQTGLERQEALAQETIFGKPNGVGNIDKSMLEISETNRWTFDSYQSELSIAWRMLHDALVACENADAEPKAVRDSQTGQWTTATVRTDSFAWMLHIDQLIKTNQLTVGQNSRLMHLRQTAAMSSIYSPADEEAPSFWRRMLGG